MQDLYQLGDIGADLLSALRSTWQCVTNPNHEDFDSTYIQATALNPQLAVTLSSDQISIAKSLIQKEVSKRARRSIAKSKGNNQNGKKLAMGVDSLLANVFKNNSSDGADEAFALYGDFLQSMKNEGVEAEQNMVNQYFEEISSSVSGY